MAKGRRRWTVRLVLLGALVWLLGWQGLGWLSGPGGGEQADAAQDAQPEPRSAGAEEESGPEVVDPPPSPPGGARGDSGPGGSEDDVQALLRLTRKAVETGMLGGGFRALDELDGLPIAAARREESQKARAALEQHLQETVTALREAVCGGRLLAARPRAGGLLRIPHAAVTRALGELARSRGWPELRDGDAPAGYVPEPRPLPAERVVRFYRNGVEMRARVVDSTPAEVTVRLADERGVTYPSLAVTRVELPEATAAEAAEMGLAALRAGDVLLARLWLCLGLELGGGPRCRELEGCLG